MNYLVMTSDRKPVYIKYLIPSFRSISNETLDLFVDGIDKTYLNNFQDESFIKIHLIDKEEDDIMKLKSKFERISNNYKKCLSFKNAECIIFEDDVIFSTTWEKKYKNYISQLKEKYGENFILSFFTSKNIKQEGNDSFVEYPHSLFYGGLGIYYTNTMRKMFLEFLNDTNELRGYDERLRDFIIARKIPVFVTIPCLIQHIGVISTWNKSKYTDVAIEFI